MNLIDRLFRKGKQTAQYIQSTIRTGERHRYSAWNPDAAEAVSMAFGIPQIACQRIAQDVASVPLRLYKPASQSTGPGRAVRVGRATKVYLASGAAGRKAATYRADDELEMVTDHPILDALAKPNSYQSGMEFRAAGVVFKLLTGSSYILPDPDDMQRHWLYPQYVRVVGGRESMVDSFVYGRATESQVRFGPDEVWWSRYSPSPFSPLEGWSPLRAVMSEQQLYAAVNQCEMAIFDNTGRPDYIASFEGSIDPEGLRAMKADFEAKHRGAQNAGRGAWIGNTKVAVQPLGWAPKDLGNIDLQRHVAGLIAAALRVPESEIFLNDANLASSATGNKQYLRNAVMPLAVQDGEDYTRWIVEEWFGLDGWCLAPENMVGTDYAQETITLSTQVGAGITTINEARLALGYEALPDPEADKLRVSGVPLDKLGQSPQPFGGGIMTLSHGPDAEPKSAARPDPAGEPAGDSPAGVEDDGGGVLPQLEAVVRPAFLPAGTAEACGPGCGCTGHRAVTQRAHWEADAKAWVKEVKPQDQSPYREDETATVQLYRKVRSALEARRDEILSATEAKPFGLESRRHVGKADPGLFDRLLSAWGISGQAQRFAEALASDTEAEIRSLFDAGVDAGLAQVAAVGELPTLDNSRTVDYFTNYQSAYIRGLASVDGTTARMVEDAIRAGLEEGESLRALQGRIREAFDATSPDGQTMTEWRSAMVARSETARGAVQGRLGGYAAAGVQSYKFLLAPNSCEFCEAVASKFADKAVPVGEPLFKQGDTLEGADGGVMKLDFDDTIVPVHPNCRCDIVPVVG